MTPIPRATLDTALTAFQRELARAIWPPVAISAIAIVGFLFALISVEGQPPYPTAVVLVGVIIAFLLIQVPLFYFRRSVRRLSTKHGLICPSCGAHLGFGYATLRRTGACRVCGSNVTTA
jgi:hypothetical protein